MPRSGSHLVLRRLAPLLGLSLLLALTACGGGGGGGAAGQRVSLVTVEFGRLLSDPSGDQVVSPLTTVRRDPVTGFDDPDTLQPLSAQVDVSRRFTFGLGSQFTPPVVPRNGTLVLQFNQALDPASVYPDQLDENGFVTRNGTVQIRYVQEPRQKPRGVHVDLEVRGREVWVRTITDRAYGLPPSPLAFDAAGRSRADATGMLKLVLPRRFGPTVRGLGGASLQARTDGLGEEEHPIGFNPGNQVLDFVVLSGLATTNTYNGFLPDHDSPRIVREHTDETRLDLAAGDVVNAFSILDQDASFNTQARQGQGEWAGALLVVRPGRSNEEVHRVTHNSRRRLVIDGRFQKPPSDGDLYRLSRVEYYEPDPNQPIDPSLYDAYNPENARNNALASFIEVFEIDSQGQVLIQGSRRSMSVYGDVPAFSELRVRFSEPIDTDSLAQWETFQVHENPDPGFGNEVLTRLVWNPGQDQVRIQPALVQRDGSVRVVGWGPGRRALRLSLSSVPSIEFLRQSMSGTDIERFLETGPRGITDLAGQPLAFPSSVFDVNDPLVRYSEPLFTDEAVSTTNPPPVSEDWGVIVHRFLGGPESGTDGPTGQSGARYLDQKNHYLPLADINLSVNGHLSAQPISYVSKIHDDFFPPPDGQFGAFPFGVSYPLMSFRSSAVPFEHNGVRFQHVFRDVDASPGSYLKGTLLDLYRVSFAPVGGGVTSDVYQDVSVHVAHSYIRPFTNQAGGGALQPVFGLSDAFDFSSYRKSVLRAPNRCRDLNGRPLAPNMYDKSRVTVVPPGTRWSITPGGLYQPPGSGNRYHPWPAFQKPFQYNNGDYPREHREQRRAINQLVGSKVWVNRDKLAAQFGMGPLGDSLLIEYRVRPQAALLSGANGFTFAPAILTSPFPFFRVFSSGVRGSPLDPDDIGGDVRARCATPVGRAAWGDNSRYFTVFDYVKTTSVVTSPYVRTRRTGAPTFGEPIVWPPLDRLSSGSSITLQFEGATGAAGKGGIGFTNDAADHDGMPFLAFRARMVGSEESTLTPTLDLVAIPYRRD